MNLELVYLSNEIKNQNDSNTSRTLLDEIFKNINNGSYNTVSVPPGKFEIKFYSYQRLKYI